MNRAISFVSLLGVLSFCVPAEAQWSSDPAQNLVIADKLGDQVQAKVLPTSDGGCYISWFDNSPSGGGGYDVYLQRLNRKGIPQWPHNGVLVADLNLSSTNDYGLAQDSAGNAILAFQDDRSGSTRITVNKVHPGGGLLWGPLGVTVSLATGFNPKVAAVSFDFIVVGWSEGSGVKLQRLDPNGTPLWAAGGIAQAPTTGSYSMSDLRASDGGNIITLWVRPTGGITSPRHLYAQKISPAGAGLWNAGNPVIVYDGGSVQNGYFPTFIADHLGGAIFGWYENSGVRNGYVQRVDTNGAEQFPHNGVACSTNTTGRGRISASVAYNPPSDEIFLYWSDVSLPVQSNWGVYGQKFNGATGQRQWTDNGKELVPLGSLQPSFVNAMADTNGHSMAVWFDQAGNGARVMGVRLDGDGNHVWGNGPVAVCDTPSSKARLHAATSACGEALAVWTDGRSTVLNALGDIYAQNVKPNGTFGAKRTGDVNGDNVVNVADLLAVISSWGSCKNCAADIAPEQACTAGDGSVNVADLLMVISNWG